MALAQPAQILINAHLVIVIQILGFVHLALPIANVLLVFVLLVYVLVAFHQWIAPQGIVTAVTALHVLYHLNALQITVMMACASIVILLLIALPRQIIAVMVYVLNANIQANVLQTYAPLVSVLYAKQYRAKRDKWLLVQVIKIVQMEFVSINSRNNGGYT